MLSSSRGVPKGVMPEIKTLKGPRKTDPAFVDTFSRSLRDLVSPLGVAKKPLYQAFTMLQPRLSHLSRSRPWPALKRLDWMDKE